MLVGGAEWGQAGERRTGHRRGLEAHPTASQLNLIWTEHDKIGIDNLWAVWFATPMRSSGVDYSQHIW